MDEAPQTAARCHRRVGRRTTEALPGGTAAPIAIRIASWNILDLGKGTPVAERAGQAPAKGGDELGLRLPPELSKGRNTLVIEFLKTQERCRGALVSFRDKEGKVLRDLTYGGE